jgi:hypothetical protein
MKQMHELHEYRLRDWLKRIKINLIGEIYH